MKKLRNIISIIAVAFVFLIMPQSIKASDRIEATNMDIKINVREDGVYEIQQKLDVYFHGQNQGIYVTVPQEYRNYSINGIKGDYFFPVSNFEMISDDKVSIDHRSEGLVATIGTKGQYHTGAKTYEYRYEIQTRPIGQEGFDLFYFNLVGDTWDFPIKNVDFTVTFPKPFSNDPFFYATSDNRHVDYTVDGNTISGTYSGGLNRQSLTMELQLDEGYFNYVSVDSTPIVLTIAVLMGIAIVALYYKFGKEDKPIEVVSFEAPEGLSSAEIGYIYRGQAASKDIVSLIVYWASKGFISLEELDEKGDNIQISKLKELENYTNPEEKRVFNALFKKGDVISTDQLNETFGQTVAHATGNISKRFTSNKDLRVFDRKSSVVKGIAGVIVPLVMGAFVAYAYYAETMYPGDMILGFLLGFFMSAGYLVFAVMGFNGDGMYVAKKSKGLKFSMGALALVLLAVFTVTTIAITKVALWKMIILDIVLFASSIAISNMSRRTPKGNEWYGEILGLENFILMAEEDRLKALVEETPYIFFDILPYAYVLGITDKWIKKFEKLTITQPDWYVSSRYNSNFTTFYMLNSLNRSMSTINSSMVSVPAPKGSSGGGGSFGGGGGGGFSGGGFGGGGGGGW